MGFVEKIRLKEQAEENIYFKERDRELVARLHQSKKTPRSKCAGIRYEQFRRIFSPELD